MSKYIKPPASEDCKWHSGPPPSVGWWPASWFQDPTNLRYWDGKVWSSSTTPNASSVSVGYAASIAASGQSDIEWADRWWLKGGEA